MADPYVSEIRLMSFVFPPSGWALCNGQLLPINQNQALFSLLGTTYGGDGRVNFALPDFRGRVPVHVGAGHTLGERGGEVAHTLTTAQLPEHTHWVNASSSQAVAPVPEGALLATGSEIYAQPATPVGLNETMVGNVGGSQSHNNMQPFLTISFCIALQGIFPSQN